MPTSNIMCAHMHVLLSTNWLFLQFKVGWEGRGTRQVRIFGRTLNGHGRFI